MQSRQRSLVTSRRHRAFSQSACWKGSPARRLTPAPCLRSTPIALWQLTPFPVLPRLSLKCHSPHGLIGGGRMAPCRAPSAGPGAWHGADGNLRRSTATRTPRGLAPAPLLDRLELAAVSGAGLHRLARDGRWASRGCCTPIPPLAGSPSPGGAPPPHVIHPLRRSDCPLSISTVGRCLRSPPRRRLPFVNLYRDGLSNHTGTSPGTKMLAGSGL